MNEKKDFLITIDVNFRKRFVINSTDYETAEQYAIDEAFSEIYNPYDEDCLAVEVFDTEIV